MPTTYTIKKLEWKLVDDVYIAETNFFGDYKILEKLSDTGLRMYYLPRNKRGYRTTVLTDLESAKRLCQNHFEEIVTTHFLNKPKHRFHILHDNEIVFSVEAEDGDTAFQEFVADANGVPVEDVTYAMLEGYDDEWVIDYA